MHAKYVVGCDGARSAVRESIGASWRATRPSTPGASWTCWPSPTSPTSAPSARSSRTTAATSCSSRARAATCSACTSTWARSPPNDNGAVRETTIEQIIAKANQILQPVHARREERGLAQRLRGRRTGSPTGSTTCRSDDAATRTPARLHRRRRLPHAQRQGRPGHERLDAGRLQHRLEARPRARRARSPESLLATYSAERQVIAKNLIDFDKQWSTLMAAKPEELDDPAELEQLLREDRRVPGRIHDPVRAVDADRRADTHQDARHRASRSASASSPRRSCGSCDGNPVQLGHHAPGRRPLAHLRRSPTRRRRRQPAVGDWADWLTDVRRTRRCAAHARAGSTIDAWFDVKVDLPAGRTPTSTSARVPDVFLPRTGPFGLDRL